MVTIRNSHAQTAPPYAGPERRRAPRMSADYPLRVRSVLPSGATHERFAQVLDVSAEGLMFGCVDGLEPGTRVDVSVAIPYAQGVSLPGAQLDAEAVVLRCEPSSPDEAAGFGKRIALKFLSKPVVLTEVSMFD
jgi:hypothetical protein